MIREKNFKGEYCIKGCDHPARDFAFCRMHYERWRRHGHPLIVLRVKPDRTKLAKSETKEYQCWDSMKARCNPEKRYKILIMLVVVLKSAIDGLKTLTIS